MKIAVVIVTYNRLEVLKASLEKVRNQSLSPDSICIVDNGSSDETPQYLVDLSKEDNMISYVLHPENIGYGGGLALGMKHAMQMFQPDLIWMMDDDSMPHPNALQLLVDKHLTTGYELIGLTGYRYKAGKKFTIDPSDGIEAADFVLVDNALLDTKVLLEVGYPSADFFMMCEDYEYCKRLHQKHFKVGVIPNNHVERMHLGSQKFSRATLWRGYYHSRNHLLILKDHFSFPAMFHYIITQSKFLLGGLQAPDRWLRLKLRLMGVYHGMRSVKGKTLQPDTLKFKY